VHVSFLAALYQDVDMHLQAQIHCHTQDTQIQLLTKYSICRETLHKKMLKQDVRSSFYSLLVTLSFGFVDYELVRIYHPDSAVSRVLPSTIAQARFQAISSAYDVLRGKTYHPSAENVSNEVDRAKVNFRNLETAMWKARQQRRAELRDGFGLDDRWKDAMMLGAVVLVSPALPTIRQFYQFPP
jgi:hypothetical protein